MVEIIFILNEHETIFKGKPEEKMKEIFQKFALKESKNIDNLYFLYNGNKVNEELTLDQLINKSEIIKNKIYINVKYKDKPTDNGPTINEANLIKSKEIICPECYDYSRISIKDFKITLYGCKNGHLSENILLSEFEKTQELDNTNKIGNNCEEHYDSFISYCTNCKKNLCFDCVNDHQNCKLIDFQTIKPKINDIENNIIKLKSRINKCNLIIESYIKKLNNIKNNIYNYYNIINNIFNNYKNNLRNRNYTILKNVNDIIGNNENTIKDLEKVINSEGLDQIKKLNALYEKINFSNEIIIKYRIEPKADSVQIFGRCFVEKYEDICKYIYDNKEYKLEETLNFKDKSTPKDDILTIKLIGIDKVSSMRCLFNECSLLLSVPNIHQWNTHKITDMSRIFSLCESLSSLPDISKWDTSNVTTFKEIFKQCKSLLSLPDISVWNTSNVTDIKGMFYECSTLTFLPDISKWDTSNLQSMSELFGECSSLIQLPDISNWNLDKVNNLNRIFFNCSNLKTLPDISKWKTNNIDNMGYLFRGCSSLVKLPDISKWNTDNVSSMNSMFMGCSSLIELPDITKWNYQNVVSMKNMFSGCISLLKLPDLSKMNTTKNPDMSQMFEGVNATY